MPDEAPRRRRGRAGRRRPRRRRGTGARAGGGRRRPGRAGRVGPDGARRGAGGGARRRGAPAAHGGSPRCRSGAGAGRRVAATSDEVRRLLASGEPAGRGGGGPVRDAAGCRCTGRPCGGHTRVDVTRSCSGRRSRRRGAESAAGHRRGTAARCTWRRRRDTATSPTLLLRSRGRRRGPRPRRLRQASHRRGSGAGRRPLQHRRKNRTEDRR